MVTVATLSLLAGTAPLGLRYLQGERGSLPAPAEAAGAFSDGFDGAPGAPLPFRSEHWEVSFATEWGTPLESAPVVGRAQHGPGCEPPGEDGSVTHSAPLIKNLVFRCANHVMTHLPAHDYAVIYLTPDQLADLRNGPATIRFDVSTVSRSWRDWIDIWVQGWDTQEQRILDEAIPTSHGNPRHAVHIEMGDTADGFFESATGTFHVEVFDGNRSKTYLEPTGPGWSEVLKRSAMTRSTVEIVLSRTHIKVWMPQHNVVWVDQSIPALGFTEGVVSFGHHSYSASKGDDPLTGAAVGQANTWHWDNMSVSPSIPFTIVHSDHRAALWEDSAAARTFNFAMPAPPNSVLRFEAFGTAARVSFDGGPFVSAPRTGPYDSDKGFNPSSYLVPVPTGTTRATFEVTPAFGFVGQVSNPTIFGNRGTPSTAAPFPPADGTNPAPPTGSAPPAGGTGGGAPVGGPAPASAGGPLVLGAPTGGIALLVTGETVSARQLVESLNSIGCGVAAIAVLENGRWLVLVPGAPARVNEAFPAQLLERTAFFVRCSG